MSRWFNIGGPCNPANHYMLPATERLPEVVSLIRKQQYFVVHAPRQCGKTTAFQALADEINAKGEMAAFYCSIENVQGIVDPEEGLRQIGDVIRQMVELTATCFGENVKAGGRSSARWRSAADGLTSASGSAAPSTPSR